MSKKNGLKFSGFENIQQQGHCSTFLGKNGGKNAKYIHSLRQQQGHCSTFLGKNAGKTLNIYIRCVSNKAIVQLSSVKMQGKR